LEKCGRCKEFAAAGIRTTRSAKEARRKNEVRKDRRSNKDDGKSRPGIIYKWNPKRVDVREETSGGSGRQHWCEGSKHKTSPAA
jgi:hypothetical protein